MWRPSLVVAVVATAYAAAPGSAVAASQCGQRVLDAWSNNKLGPNYPVACYEWALTHLPADVEGYSSASADIRRQLLAAIRQRGNRTTQGVAAATHTLTQETRTKPRLLLAVGGVAVCALLLTGVRTVRRPKGAIRRAASKARSRSPRSR